MQPTPKKTVKTMIEQGNDYVITVANQKSLHQRLRVISRDCPPVSVYHPSEQGHQRQTQRTVEVFDC